MGSVIGYQEAHGPVATFETNMAGKIKNLVVDINPVQSGSGDPSPDNVRPITGWTGVSVTVNGEVIDITFPSEAGTVYGGTVDVVNGVLTVDRAEVDLGEYAASMNHNGIRNGNQLVALYVTGKQPGLDNFISSVFVVATSAIGVYSMHGRTSNATVEFEIPLIALGKTKDDPVADRVAAARQWFVDNASQFCYELATPIAYNLTPQEINTIIGTNTIYADIGDTSVIYPKTITPIETVSNVSLMELRRNIIAAQANDNLYDKWVWRQNKNDFVIRNNTVGFLEGVGNNIYADQRSDRENNRKYIVAKRGNVSFVAYDSVSGGTHTPVKLYPIPIPPNANNVRISCDNDTQDLNAGAMVLRLENGVYRQIKNNTNFFELLHPLWLVTGNKHYLAPYFRRSDLGDFISELENIQLTFSHDGQWQWTLTGGDIVAYKRNTMWKSAISKMCFNSDSNVNNYLTITTNDGFCGYCRYDETKLNDKAPIPVPPTATKVTVTTTPVLQAHLMLVKALDDQTQEFITDNDFKSTPVTMTFNADDNLELAVSLRVNSSASNFTTSTTPTEIIVQFE